MEISKEKVEGLLELVRKHFPAWDSFDDKRFMEEEITYKKSAVAKAQEMLSKELLRGLLEQGKLDEFIQRLEKIGHTTNLLWTVVPMSGDLGILYQQNLDKASFCKEIFELLHGAAPTNERLMAYTEYVKEKELPNKWTFPTYFLFLCHPDFEVFIKPSVVKWFLDFLGASEKYTSRPSSSCYQTVKQACEKLKEDLKDLGAKDMIDIQSIIWVAASVAKDSYRPPIEQNRLEEFVKLFKEFSASYPNTVEGQRHIRFYNEGRLEGRRNYEEILSEIEQGKDTTDTVLLRLLPYTDSENNRAKGLGLMLRHRLKET